MRGGHSHVIYIKYVVEPISQYANLPTFEHP